jgi:uncharacterized membrane protein
MSYLVKSVRYVKNTEQYFPASKAKVILFIILWICSIIACLLKSQTLLFGLFSTIISIIFWRSNFSNSFDMTGNKLISLYGLMSTGSLFGFGIIII